MEGQFAEWLAINGYKGKYNPVTLVLFWQKKSKKPKTTQQLLKKWQEIKNQED